MGSVVVSDGFFPFRDGVDAAIKEGVTGVIQPGGSERDFEVITACNEANVTMVFAGQEASLNISRTQTTSARTAGERGWLRELCSWRGRREPP